MKTSIRSTLALVVALLILIPAGTRAQSGYDLFQKALTAERAEGNLTEAINLYQRIVREFSTDRALVAKALVQMGHCYEKQGKAEALKAYERVVHEFADQPEAAEARARLAVLTEPSLTVPASAVLTRRITEDPMLDLEGPPSSDGRFLPATDWSTGDVALIEVATGQKRRVTNKGTWAESSEFAEFPVLSPDGKRIAYSWWWGPPSKVDLRVINADGTSPRVLVSGEGITDIWPTAWTPDGNSILVFIDRADGTFQIALVSAADGKVRVLKTLPSGRGTYYKASISPDGRYVVYDYPPKEDSPQRDIFLLPVGGGQELPLVQHAANDFAPLWTPDGRSVVFVSDRTGSLSLWRIRVAGGKPQGSEELLRSDVGNVLLPIGFSARGSFFYSVSAGREDVYEATLDLATGKVTTAPAPVSQGYAAARWRPQWSPDGKSLVWMSRRGPSLPMAGFHALSIFSVDSGRERELGLAVNRILRVRWSPDAREILVTASDPQGRRGLFRVDARTGETTPVVIAAGSDLRWGRWSPDGKSVFFVRFDYNKENTIVERNLQSGEEKELGRYTLPEAYVAGFDLSPDGQQMLLYLTRLDPPGAGGRFTVIPIAGGQPRDLYHPKDTIELMAVHPFWTPDGKNILFLQNPGQRTDPQPAPTELWRLSVETGKAEKLGLAMQGLSSVTIHPDGKRVAFTAGQSKSEIWVMENLLPAPRTPK
jgi:Tol biopolymer transport system component